MRAFTFSAAGAADGAKRADVVAWSAVVVIAAAAFAAAYFVGRSLGGGTTAPPAQPLIITSLAGKRPAIHSGSRAVAALPAAPIAPKPKPVVHAATPQPAYVPPAYHATPAPAPAPAAKPKPTIIIPLPSG